MNKRMLTMMLTSIVTPTLVTDKSPDPDSMISEFIQETCSALTSYSFACELFNWSLRGGNDITFGYHNVANASYAGEKTLSYSIFRSICDNYDIRNLFSRLKSNAKSDGTAFGSSSNVTLDDSRDLKYSINKCNVQMRVDYNAKENDYSVFVTITDTYDFVNNMAKEACSLSGLSSGWENCAIAVVNDTAALAQANNLISKFDVTIRVDYKAN